MWLLALLGTGMVVFGLIMASKPLNFAAGIVAFSEKPWFHLFEIFSRLILGLLFLLFADTTPYSMLFNIVGGVLCFVAALLMLMGSSRHKAFARKSSGIGKYFRPIGLVAIVLGSGLIFMGVTHYV